MAAEGPSHVKKYYYENEDERSVEERAIDDWLPITASRTAKWWHSAFHNVTAVVGAGVLGLPYAMSQLGWGPGLTALALSWIITLYSLWQMVEMHETIRGKRFDRYHELGQHAFGEKLGLWIVVPQQLIVEVGVDIVYMITGGKSLQKFHNLVCSNCKNIKLTYFIMIFASVHFALSQLSSFNSISGVSLAAAVMSLRGPAIAVVVSWIVTPYSLWQMVEMHEMLPGKRFDSYSRVAWVASVEKGVQPASASVAFAYGGHNVVMEIQATMPSTPHSPSKKPMWKGVVVAYVIVALCYFPVAVIGYWKFGNAVDENILISLKKPVWLIAMANRFSGQFGVEFNVYKIDYNFMLAS